MPKVAHQQNVTPTTLPQPAAPQIDMGRVASIILGGGQGTRLFPLTHSRCKPATPFGGRYRLIDVPVSNSINSGIFKIFVVTQFLSSSLHNHIFQSYRFDQFSSGFVDVLAAEQKPTSAMWFQGTADAVRQSVDYFSETPADYFLILSGDQLYNFDFRHMMAFAKDSDADLVVACLPVEEPDATRMGVLAMDDENTIVEFCEKPQDPELLKRLRRKDPAGGSHLASMGIYLFRRNTLFDLLQSDPREDFGKHLIPTMVEEKRAKAYMYEGYWEDIGTIEAFHKANLLLTTQESAFNLYDPNNPIYGAPKYLPGPRIEDTHVSQSIICEGAIIQADEVRHSILGTRAYVGKGSIIQDTYLMGNDFCAPPIRQNNALPESFGIGEQCVIKNAIIDRNSRIGNRVQLVNKDKLTHYNGENIFVRDGVIIVPRGADLPDGFVL